MLSDRRVQTGERPEPRVVMRVGEEPHVEHQVGLARQSEAIGERGHEDGEGRAVVEREVAGHDPPQVAHRQLGGVEDEVGPLAQPLDQVALVPDAVDHRAVVGERVAAAGLGVPALQDLVVAVDEQDADIEVLAGCQRCDFGLEGVNREVAGAHVDVDGQRLAPGGAGAQQGREQLERQIVDRLVAVILERLERGRLARSRHAGDQHQPGARRRVRRRFGAGRVGGRK